ncbi:MAG: STAS domain-containing protein [Spirochaetes bacterium]|jgi:anti-anti-sigma factor|nr:STAS domain-containing protein [Spirochaetota bacterium]
MEIIKEKSENCNLFIRLAGDSFERLSSDSLEKSFAELIDYSVDDIKELYLNCESVPFINSAGIGLLVRLHLIASRKNLRLYLGNIQPSVMNILRATNLDRDFNLV